MDKDDIIEIPDEQLGFLLMQVYQQKQRIINSVLKKWDLTYIQFVILTAILELGKDGTIITQQTISRERRLDKAMVSNVIKTLMTKRLIIRTEHPVDSRSKILEISSQGKKIAIVAKEMAKNIDHQFFRSIDEDQLRKNLKKVLADNNKEYDE